MLASASIAGLMSHVNCACISVNVRRASFIGPSDLRLIIENSNWQALTRSPDSGRAANWTIRQFAS
jgi:hypothetical protein